MMITAKVGRATRTSMKKNGRAYIDSIVGSALFRHGDADGMPNRQHGGVDCGCDGEALKRLKWSLRGVPVPPRN